MRKYFDQMRIAGVQYHEALFCREELKAGRKLRMVRDTENKYDADAVALYCGEYLVGYIPRTENSELALFLDQGWGDLFEVFIFQGDEDAHPENQYLVNIYLRDRKDIGML